MSFWIGKISHLQHLEKQQQLFLTDSGQGFASATLNTVGTNKTVLVAV